MISLAHNIIPSSAWDYSVSAEMKMEDPKSFGQSFSSDELDQAAVLSISDKGLRQAKELGNEFSRIQKFLTRGVQLSVEATDDDLTQLDKQTIHHEIQKIRQEINYLYSNPDSDGFDALGSSIDMTGDLVSHARDNILTQASDAFMAQATSDYNSVFALLQ